MLYRHILSMIFLCTLQYNGDSCSCGTCSTCYGCDFSCQECQSINCCCFEIKIKQTTSNPLNQINNALPSHSFAGASTSHGNSAIKDQPSNQRNPTIRDQPASANHRNPSIRDHPVSANQKTSYIHDQSAAANQMPSLNDRPSFEPDAYKSTDSLCGKSGSCDSKQLSERWMLRSVSREEHVVQCFTNKAFSGSDEVQEIRGMDRKRMVERRRDSNDITLGREESSKLKSPKSSLNNVSGCVVLQTKGKHGNDEGSEKMTAKVQQSSLALVQNQSKRRQKGKVQVSQVNAESSIIEASLSGDAKEGRSVENTVQRREKEEGCATYTG